MNSREKVTAFRNKWLPEVGYDFQMEMVKMLDQHAEEARVDQGEACAKDVFAFLPKASPEQVAYAFEVKEICLNATGESDEC